MGQIYVEEHKAIIEADGAAMAVDTNRELGALDKAGSARFIDAQTALRALTFGLIVRVDGAVLAYSGRTIVPDYKVQQHIREAKGARGSVAFVDTGDSAVISVVELDTPVADYLIVGRLINEVAVADWTRVQNYIGGSTQSSGVWMAFAALGLLVVAIVGSWWVATRLSRKGRAQHSLNHRGERRQ